MNESAKPNAIILFRNSVIISILFILGYTHASTLDDLWMKNVSKKFAEDLDIIKNEELSVEHVKSVYSTFKYTANIVDANRTVNRIAHKLELKIEEIFSALSYGKFTIENIQVLDNSSRTLPSLLRCVKNENFSERSSRACGNCIFKSSKELLKIDYVLQNLKLKVRGIKQQYFISAWDVESYSNSPFTHCNKINHMLLWNNYMLRNVYVPKNIVLLIDHGGSLSRHHFYIVKSMAKQIVSSLTENDSIAILAISNNWTTPGLNDDECLMPNQVPYTDSRVPKLSRATASKKKILYKFIDGLNKGNGATNHSLGLEKSLQVVEEQVQNETVMILYVSRGLLSSLTEAKVVLENILEVSGNINTPFVINTCTVIDETKPTIYETQFMEDIALQNYEKYNISTTKTPQIGTMVAVNSSEFVGFAISHFYAMYNVNSSFYSDEKLSLPTYDDKSDDFTISFTTGCWFNNQFGLLGVDVYFPNLVEEVVYFNNNRKHQYIFLIDTEGNTILHPLFPPPASVKQQLHYVDITHFENVRNFAQIREKLLSESNGIQTEVQFGFNIKYTWRRVGNWYVVCMVTRELMPTRPYKVTWPPNSENYNITLFYQQLRNGKGKLCHHNQVATVDAGSLYLSSSCFLLPTSFDEENREPVQNLMAYLQDNSLELPNPGLKEGIKDEVAAMAHILNLLRIQHFSSYKSKYIVRRYVSSHSGILQTFPGSILDDGLDPTQTSWFIQAVEHKSKLVLIPPYLDESGSGYIVTVAYATSNVVVAVDFTYGYVFRMLLKQMPFCTSANITCFLMDDRGYLIYHPNLIDPNGRGPVEKQHIVHKESLVANDILGNSLFIQKKLCNSYGGSTVQRYYSLNTSYSDVLVNLVQGEHCVSYHIVAVPNTNIFIGMVNATCNVVVTFCPCSIVDRLCLNCNRMEQKECECPCECPLEKNNCTDYLDNPTCSWFPELSAPPVRDEAENEVTLCFPATCAEEKTQRKCLSVTGCEWCKFDVDGSPLINPFCASMATCFNGIVGSITPKVDVAAETFSVPMSFLMLFIIGVLVALCLFYVYYRSTNAPVAERLYLSSTQDNHLRMSDLNLSDNYHSAGNHRDKLLQDEKPDPISPYCVTGNYRRTPLAADSDHGYSTMTQHDESEHMSLAPVELESLEDDLTLTESTEAAQFTCIPKNNCIVVPVTVHRNMETT